MSGLGVLIAGTARTQDLAFATYNAALEEGLASIRSEDLWYTELTMQTNSTTQTEVYDWLEQIADFSPWKGPRRFQPLRESAYALTNEPFQFGVEIDKQKFNDHRFLNEAQIFRAGGVNARMHPQRSVARLLAAFSETKNKCYDGRPYFDHLHPVDVYDSSKGVYSNRITNSLTPANFALARAAMMKMVDSSGEILPSPPDALFVSPDLVTTADMIAASIAVPTISGSSINSGVATAPRQRIRVIECPELAGEPGIWYLGRCKGFVKPCIFQKRSDPAVEWISDLNSEYCKTNRAVRLGADYEAAFGFTFPHLLMRCGDSSASTTLS